MEINAEDENICSIVSQGWLLVRIKSDSLDSEVLKATGQKIKQYIIREKEKIVFLKWNSRTTVI